LAFVIVTGVLCWMLWLDARFFSRRWSRALLSAVEWSSTLGGR